MEKEKEEYQLLNFLKANITVILLGLYSLGFINHYFYYSSFEISIFNYIGLNDMIFFSLEYIFKIFLLILLFEIAIQFAFIVLFGIYERYILFIHKKKLLLYLRSNHSNKKRIRNVIEEFYNDYLNGFRLIITLMFIFIIPLLPNQLISVPTYLIYFLSVFYFTPISKNERELDSIHLIFAIIVLVLSIFVTSLVNSYEKRFEKDNYAISFYENSNYITTDKEVSHINYLGETSTHIFLYDIEKKESKIYFKENITELKIKNSNTIDSYILKIKDNLLFKSFLEDIEKDDAIKKERRERFFNYFSKRKQ